MQCCAATAQSLHLTSVTGKTFFLEFACNLRSHCFGEGTRVEHFSDFGGFCSTFEAALTDFGVDGRQKSVIPTGFCLLAPEIQRRLRAKGRFKSTRNPAPNAAAFTAFVK